METRTAVTVTNNAKRGKEKLKSLNVDLNGYVIKTPGRKKRERDSFRRKNRYMCQQIHLETEAPANGRSCSQKSSHGQTEAEIFGSIDRTATQRKKQKIKRGAVTKGRVVESGKLMPMEEEMFVCARNGNEDES